MLSDIFPTEESFEDISVSKLGFKSNIPKPTEGRSKYGFVGLQNQGATCYLNSLLQTMFMTPELRLGIFNLDPDDLGLQQVEEYEQSKLQDAKNGVVVVDEALLNQISPIFAEPLVRKALIATKNADANQVIEYIYSHQTDMEAEILAESQSAIQHDVKRKKKKPRLIPLELQRLFSQLQSIDQSTISTEDLTTKGFQWQGMDGSVQHDAHELNRLLIDALEKSLKHTAGDTLCRDIYQGTLAYQTKCLNCNYTSYRTEPYYDLNVQVIDCKNLIESLRKYCTAEVLDGDSAYHCDTCNSKQKAHRTTVISKLPPLLIFSLNRFRIDKSTNWMREKVTAHSSFPLTVSFDSFVTGSENDENSQVCSPFIDESTETGILNTLNSQACWLDDVHPIALEIATGLIARHGDGITLANLDQDERIDIDRKIYNSAAFRSEIDERGTKQFYELASVIMHRGSAFSGHYFAYIRDSFNEGKWEIDDSEFEDFSYCNMKSNLTKANTKVNTALNEGVVQYIKASDDCFIIDKSSPLGQTMSIVDDIALTDSSKGDAKYFTTDKFNKTFKLNFGVTWSTKFRPSCGTLVQFLDVHKELFDYQSHTKIYLKTSNISYIEPSSDLFEQEPIPMELSEYVTKAAAEVGEIDMNMLIDEEELEEIESAIKTADAVEGWEVVPKGSSKSKKPKSSKPSTTTTASSSSSSTHIETTTNTTSDSTSSGTSASAGNSIAQRKLANDILGFYFGRFYEFNDSVVKPMLLKDVGLAFEGRDSAYLLLYRKAPKLPSLLNIETRPQTSSLPPPLPAYWAEKIQTINSDLENARILYKSQSEMIRIHIKCPRHFIYRSPLLYLQPSVSSGASDGTDPMGLPIDQPGDDITMECNSGSNLEDIMEMFKIEYSKHFSTLGLLDKDLRKTSDAPLKFSSRQKSQRNTNNSKKASWNMQMSEIEATHGDLVFSVLESYEDGYHIHAALDKSTSISEVLNKGSFLLAWNNKSINNVFPISIGDSAKPVSYNVTLLTNGEEISASAQSFHSPTNVKTKATAALTVPKVQTVQSQKIVLTAGMTAEEACQQVLNVFDLQKDRYCVHLSTVENKERKNIDNDSFGFGIRTRKQSNSTVSSSSVPSKSVESPLILLWNKIFAYKPSIQGPASGSKKPQQGSAHKQGGAGGSGSSASSTSSSSSVLLSELCGFEFFVEDIESRGMHSVSLAEAEMVRRSQQSTLTVEIDLSKDFIVSVVDENIAASALSTPSAGEDIVKRHDIKPNSQIKIEADEYLTIESLKASILSQLGLNYQMFKSCTRLRTGPCKGENLLDDERKTIYDFGLTSKSSIFIEQGKPPQQDMLMLKVTLVEGNDRNPKYNSTQPGIFSSEIEIEVPFTFSVTALKELIGSQLLPQRLSEGWTFQETSRRDPIAIKPILKISSLESEEEASEGDSEVLYNAYRLRMSNWQRDAGDLIDEVDELGEVITLKNAAGLVNGSMIFFEEGLTPPKGMISHKICLWFKELLAESFEEMTYAWASALVPSNEIVVIDRDVETTTVKEENIKTLINIHNSRSRYALVLGSINCYKGVKLREFQQATYELLQSQANRIAELIPNFISPVQYDYLLLREFQDDLLLPGRCHWIVDPLSTDIDISNIGMKRPLGKSGAAGSNNQASAADKALGKGPLAKNMTLVLEFLGKPQSEMRPAVGSFKLWVQLLQNPGCNEGEALMSPAWPPVEVTVNGGKSPNMGALKKAVCETFKIPSETISIFKLSKSQHDWIEITRPLLSPSSAPSSSSKKKTENILEGPTGFKDGDFICVFGYTTEFTASCRSKEISVARFEDILMKNARSEKEKEKKKAKKKRKSGTSVTFGVGESGSKAPAEIALSLGGNLEFSDEEDEEN